jgi:hypothetical protein
MYALRPTQTSAYDHSQPEVFGDRFYRSQVTNFLLQSNEEKTGHWKSMEIVGHLVGGRL